MSLCVFDLDNTLGDFRVIDYFGLLLDPKCILGFPDLSKEIHDSLKNAINSYDTYTKTQLHLLRDSFEKAINTQGYNKYIMRPKLKDILTPLVNEYKKKNIIGFVIYSNNANIYSLEYAGRTIENMFDIHELFLKYIDRMHTIRNQYDDGSEGYRTKTFNTLKKLVPEANKILFMDDLEHDDLLNSPNVIYIKVSPYICNLENDKLIDIWNIFENILNENVDFKKIFMNLYHIKNYLQYTSLEEIKKRYLSYSKNDEDALPFRENSTQIKNKISQFLGNTKGGKRKTRRFKTSRKKAHKRKYETSE